jgi:hypothetical protein
MRFVIALMYIFLLLFLFRCEPQNQADRTIEGVEVIIEDGTEFPKSLAGTWKDKVGSSWEFVIEKDGYISSIVDDFGSIRLKPGQVTEVPMKQHGKGVFEPGLWTVKYTPDIKELSIEIILDHFRVQKGTDTVEGSSTDLFIGPITVDSQQWEPQWFSFPKYTVTTVGYDNYELPVDYNDNPRASLIFEKVNP